MLLTLSTILVSLLTPMLCGLPIAWLLLRADAPPLMIWLMAPSIGIGAIIIALQNLVYLDIPLIWSAPIFWVGVGLLWIWLWKRRASLLDQVPWWTFGAALAAYAIQAIGLCILGSAFYLGRGWGDTINYVVMAEFFARIPFHSTLADLSLHPYLFQVDTLKQTERIGQSVFHAFLTLSAFSDAKTLFEPTILLISPLTVCAVALLGWQLEIPATAATGAALLAGLLPSIALVHLEGFLSHALSIPLLISWLACMSGLPAHLTMRRAILTALMLTATVSIYTEIYPLLIVISGITLTYALLSRCCNPWRAIAALVSQLLSVFVLIPMITPSVLVVLGRIDMSNVLSGLYPWAYSLDGIVRIWSGDLLEDVSGVVLGALRVITLGATLVGVYGLIRGLHTRRNAPWISVVALMSMPFLIRALDDAHPYQFYKILLSTAPLLPLGVVATFVPTEAAPAEQRSIGAPWLWHMPNQINLPMLGATTATIVLCAIAAIGTAQMVLRSTMAGHFPRVVVTPMLLSPEMRLLQTRLSELRDQHVLIADIDDTYQNYWLMYFARHNQVWVTSPVMKQEWQARLSSIQETVNPQTLPTPLYIISEHADERLSVNLQQSDLIWSGGQLRLWRVNSPDWALASQINNPNGTDQDGQTPFYWLGGGDTTFHVLLPRSAALRLDGTFFPGPSITSKPDRMLRVATDTGYEQTLPIGAGATTINLPLHGGLSKISLTPLDQPELHVLPNGDKRPIILGVRALHLIWQDDAGGVR